MHSFWLSAARMLDGMEASAAPLVVKVDDDSVVNLPLLERVLEPLRCVPRLYFGAIAFTGYRTGPHFQNCGFAWSGGGAYTKYGCASAGAHPPYPFALGQLQVLSLPLIQALAESPDASDFAAAAEASLDTLANEDSALGFMVSSLRDVSYVNMRPRSWHNLGCIQDNGMYRQPHNGSLVVHRVLSPDALRYVSQVMMQRGGADVVTCVRATLATRPRYSLQDWCRSCSSALHKQHAECREIGNSKQLAAVRTSCSRVGAHDSW